MSADAPQQAQQEQSIWESATNFLQEEAQSLLGEVGLKTAATVAVGIANPAAGVALTAYNAASSLLSGGDSKPDMKAQAEKSEGIVTQAAKKILEEVSPQPKPVEVAQPAPPTGSKTLDNAVVPEVLKSVASGVAEIGKQIAEAARQAEAAARTTASSLPAVELVDKAAGIPKAKDSGTNNGIAGGSNTVTEGVRSIPPVRVQTDASAIVPAGSVDPRPGRSAAPQEGYGTSAPVQYGPRTEGGQYGASRPKEEVAPVPSQASEPKDYSPAPAGSDAYTYKPVARTPDATDQPALPPIAKNPQAPQFEVGIVEKPPTQHAGPTEASVRSDNSRPVVQQILPSSGGYSGGTGADLTYTSSQEKAPKGLPPANPYSNVGETASATPPAGTKGTDVAVPPAKPAEPHPAAGPAYGGGTGGSTPPLSGASGRVEGSGTYTPAKTDAAALPPPPDKLPPAAPRPGSTSGNESVLILPPGPGGDTRGGTSGSQAKLPPPSDSSTILGQGTGAPVSPIHSERGATSVINPPSDGGFVQGNRNGNIKVADPGKPAEVLPVTIGSGEGGAHLRIGNNAAVNGDRNSPAASIVQTGMEGGVKGLPPVGQRPSTAGEAGPVDSRPPSSLTTTLQNGLEGGTKSLPLVSQRSSLPTGEVGPVDTRPASPLPGAPRLADTGKVISPAATDSPARPGSLPDSARHCSSPEGARPGTLPPVSACGPATADGVYERKSSSGQIIVEGGAAPRSLDGTSGKPGSLPGLDTAGTRTPAPAGVPERAPAGDPAAARGATAPAGSDTIRSSVNPGAADSVRNGTNPAPAPGDTVKNGTTGSPAGADSSRGNTLPTAGEAMRSGLAPTAADGVKPADSLARGCISDACKVVPADGTRPAATDSAKPANGSLADGARVVPADGGKATAGSADPLKAVPADGSRLANPDSARIAASETVRGSLLEPGKAPSGDGLRLAGIDASKLSPLEAARLTASEAARLQAPDGSRAQVDLARAVSAGQERSALEAHIAAARNSEQPIKSIDIINLSQRLDAILTASPELRAIPRDQAVREIVRILTQEGLTLSSGQGLTAKALEVIRVILDQKLNGAASTNQTAADTAVSALRVMPAGEGGGTARTALPASESLSVTGRLMGNGTASAAQAGGQSAGARQGEALQSGSTGSAGSQSSTAPARGTSEAGSRATGEASGSTRSDSALAQTGGPTGQAARSEAGGRLSDVARSDSLAITDKTSGARQGSDSTFTAGRQPSADAGIAGSRGAAEAGGRSPGGREPSGADAGTRSSGGKETGGADGSRRAGADTAGSRTPADRTEITDKAGDATIPALKGVPEDMRGWITILLTTLGAISKAPETSHDGTRRGGASSQTSDVTSPVDASAAASDKGSDSQGDGSDPTGQTVADPVLAALAAANRRVRYTVKLNDTLESIASSQLGDARFAVLLLTINRPTLRMHYDGTSIGYELRPGDVIWLPSPNETALHRRTFFGGSGGASAGMPAISGQCAPAGGAGATGGQTAKSLLPVHSAPDLVIYDGATGAVISGETRGTSPLCRTLEQVRFAGGRQSVPLVLLSGGATQSPRRRAYTVRLGDTLRSIAMRDPLMRDAQLWPLLARINGLPATTDSFGKPLARVSRGQQIVLPNPAEIEKYRLVGRFAAIAAATPPQARAGESDAGDQRQTATSIPALVPSFVSEVEARMVATRLSDSCRILAARPGRDAATFSTRLQILYRGNWTTLATYEGRLGRAYRHVRRPDGKTETLDVDLPASTVKEMAIEDFSRNWQAYAAEFNGQEAGYLGIAANYL